MRWGRWVECGDCGEVQSELGMVGRVWGCGEVQIK